MNSQEVAELNTCMDRLADGDRTAFDSVFELSWPIVHRFALKTVGANHDAEDVAQHALMKVFSRAQEFRAGSNALSWILGITSYECKTLRQKVRRRREEFGDDELIGRQTHEGPNAEEGLYKKSMEETVRSLLGELSPQDRETILASIEELEKPSIPTATYRKRLERALGRLREKWSDKHE